MATMRVITQSEIDARKKVFGSPEVRTAAAAMDGAKTEPSESEKKDNLLNALSKYIPVTVIIGYTYLDTIFRSLSNPPSSDPPAVLWMVCFLLLLAGTGVLTYRITKDDSTQTIPVDVRTKPDSSSLIQELESVVTNQRLKQTAIAIIAFAGYVLAIGGPFTYINKIVPGWEWQAYYGAVFLVLATLAVAIIAGKDLLAN
jgi:hypothetical protein